MRNHSMRGRASLRHRDIGANGLVARRIGERFGNNRRGSDIIGNDVGAGQRWRTKLLTGQTFATPRWPPQSFFRRSKSFVPMPRKQHQRRFDYPDTPPLIFCTTYIQLFAIAINGRISSRTRSPGWTVRIACRAQDRQVTGFSAGRDTHPPSPANTNARWPRSSIGFVPAFSVYPVSPVFGLPHLTAGTSCDSVPALPHVFSQWGNGKVVLWKLATEALSCRAGVAFSRRPPMAISLDRKRSRSVVRVMNRQYFGLAHARPRPCGSPFSCSQSFPVHREAPSRPRGLLSANASI